MRHHLSGRQLSRNAPHRHALLRALSVALLRHETIRTTAPKAKELRRVVEPLITLGKEDSEANRRLAFSRLRDSEIVAKLFDVIGPRFKARPGGYTRILRMDPRPGDAAPMALMQLLDQPEAVADKAPDTEAAETEAEAKPVRKKAAAPKKTSPKKKVVRSAEEKAVKKAKAEQKAAVKAKKVEAKSQRKAAAPKKKAAAKKKSSK